MNHSALSTRRSALLTLALLATFPIALSGVRAQRVGRASSLDILPLTRTFDCENGMADRIWNSHYTADPGDSVTAPKSRAGTLDLRAGSETSFSGVSCSDGLITYSKGSQPLSMPDTDSQSVCYVLFASGWGDLNNYQFKAAYDTLKLYLEHCYQEPNSWAAFSQVDAAVDGWSAGGIGRWPDYLTWLKSVLYLNMDTNWYCDDVLQMFTALQANPNNFDNLAVQEAVAKYIISNNRCPNLQNDIAVMGNAASNGRHQYWLDSIVSRFDTVQYYGAAQWWVDSMVNKDTMANPYDSTIPSLQQVDLQILLGPQDAVQGASSPITSQALLDATLLNNPMQDEIDVSFEMDRTALITMELRDILGRAVPLSYAKYQLEQSGTHSARIPAPNLPPGTYYLRITTDTGDVITLKVVKQ